MEPSICKIMLPSHHPAVAGLKKGESVMIHATKHEEGGEPGSSGLAGMGKDSTRSIPLQTPFHVTGINKGSPSTAARSAKGKMQSPTEYLTSRRGQPPGAKVSDMS